VRTAFAAPHLFRTKEIEMKHPEHEYLLRYLVVQVHPSADPMWPEFRSAPLTGQGTLVPMTCDGYYAYREDAEGVAELFAERHPELTTHVVEIVASWRAKP